TSAAAVGNREHVTVSIQDLRISPIATRRIRGGSGPTLGADHDRQALAPLDRQDCAGVGPATTAASAVAADNGSASASAIKFYATPVDAPRNTECAAGLKSLPAIKTWAWRAGGTLRSTCSSRARWTRRSGRASCASLTHVAHRPLRTLWTLRPQRTYRTSRPHTAGCTPRSRLAPCARVPPSPLRAYFAELA